MPDYYDILGLAHDADVEEVKSAFYRLAKIYHPDLNDGDATAEARFKKINQAYETLSDSEKRAAYDLEFRGGPRVFRHTGESRASATKSSATAYHAPSSSSRRWQVAAAAMCIGLLLGLVVVPVVLWLSGTFADSQKAKTVPALPSVSAPGDFGSGPLKVAKIAVRPIEPTTPVGGPLEPRAVELAPPLDAGRNTVSPWTVASAPRRVRIIPIQPNGPNVQAPMVAQGLDTSALAPTQTAQAQPQQPVMVASNATAPPAVDAGPVVAREAVAHKDPVVKTREASSASVIAATSGFVAVVSSQKTRLDALKAFADLQQMYGDVLASKPPDVQEANLGDKGVWYRAVVGPPGSRDAAAGICSQLKTAGYPGRWVVAY